MGPDRERKPKTIIVKVIVTPVIPAVVLSGNPDSIRFLKAGYPINKFGYDKRILHDTRLLTSSSRNCQTLGVPQQLRAFALEQLEVRAEFSEQIKQCFPFVVSDALV